MRFIGTLLAPWIFGPFFILVAIALMSEFNNLFRDSSLADNELKVLYLYDSQTDTGQRICEGGYDFREPECVYVLKDDWAGKRRRMKWAVMDRNTNEFIRYDGWYVERTDIFDDLLAMMEVMYSDSDVEVHQSVAIWHHIVTGYGKKNWADLTSEDWTYINARVEKITIGLGGYDD